MKVNKLVRNIFDGLSLAILITNGNPENPLVIYQNKKFTEISGYTPEEMLGKNPKIMQGPETNRKVIDRLKDSLRKETQFIGTTYNYHKSGEPYRVCWTVFPIQLITDHVFIAIIDDLSAMDSDLIEKILSVEKNARHISVEMLNRIQMAAELMESTTAEDRKDLVIVIKSAVRLIKEMEKIVEFTIVLMESEQSVREELGFEPALV